jgi:hypothetical protein
VTQEMHEWRVRRLGRPKSDLAVLVSEEKREGDRT